MTKDILAIGLAAMANSSRVAVDRAQLVAILASGEGPGNLVRALFGDCSFEALLEMGQATGLSSRQIRAAYRIARTKHGAANADVEAEGQRFTL